jgi:hypothetical protein
MFEQLFKRPHALARHRNGPPAEERRRYLAHCTEQQMSRRTSGMPKAVAGAVPAWRLRSCPHGSSRTKPFRPDCPGTT